MKDVQKKRGPVGISRVVTHGRTIWLADDETIDLPEKVTDEEAAPWVRCTNAESTSSIRSKHLL
jgi:hypothetical protein